MEKNERDYIAPKSFHDVEMLRKAMKKFVEFWNKDIINKLILLALAGLGIGLLALIYFLLTVPKESILYGTIFPSKNALPTLASQSVTVTSMPTPTTEFFPSMTPLPVFTSTGGPSSLLTPFTAATFASSPEALVRVTQTTASISSTVTPISTLSLASGASCIPSHTPETGRVVGVLDGYTIKVLLDSDGKIYVVRYIGIAVPKYGEAQEPYGKAAEVDNYNLVFARAVTMVSDSSDKDTSGRLLRYVSVGDQFINLQIVQDGFATAVSVSPNTACDAVFQNAEQSARQSHVGRWAATSTPSQ